MQFRASNRCNCTLQFLHQRGIRAVEILCKRAGFALYQQGFLPYQGLLQQEKPTFYNVEKWLDVGYRCRLVRYQ